MILTIDAGNSNIVAGAATAEKILFTKRFVTHPAKSADEYCALLEEALQENGISISDLEGSIISSVVPAVTGPLAEAAQKLLGKSPVIVGPNIRTDLKILTDDPSEVGADLIVAAVAAAAVYPLPQIIIDMGTATTLSAIDRSGVFIGCVIIPGMRVALESLVKGASQLVSVSLEAPEHVLGTNTVDCLKSGSVLANACMLDGMIDRIEEEMNEKTTVIATGGLAYRVVPHCRHEIILDDDLLLRGMYILFDKNR